MIDAPEDSGVVLLEAHGLSKSFAGLQALLDFTLSVRAGKIGALDEDEALESAPMILYGNAARVYQFTV